MVIEYVGELVRVQVTPPPPPDVAGRAVSRASGRVVSGSARPRRAGQCYSSSRTGREGRLGRGGGETGEGGGEGGGQVGDVRDDRALEKGKSTYMFRIDDDVIVDAMFAGNASRYMNHCCQPNCCAKIVSRPPPPPRRPQAPAPAGAIRDARNEKLQRRGWLRKSCRRAFLDSESRLGGLRESPHPHPRPQGGGTGQAGQHRAAMALWRWAYGWRGAYAQSVCESRRRARLDGPFYGITTLFRMPRARMPGASLPNAAARASAPRVAAPAPPAAAASAPPRQGRLSLPAASCVL